MTRGKLPRSLGITRVTLPRPVRAAPTPRTTLTPCYQSFSPLLSPLGHARSLSTSLPCQEQRRKPSIISPRPRIHRDALLRDPSVPMSEILKSYDMNRGIHRSVLLGLLHHPSDPGSIIALMPSFIDALFGPGSESRSGSGSESKIKYDRRLFRFLLPHVGRYKMLALLPTITDLFIQRCDQDWVKWRDAGRLSDRSSETVQNWYDSFIESLGHFVNIPTVAQKRTRHLLSISSEPLPLVVRHEVTRLISHLIELISSIPTSSDLSAQPSLTLHMFERLLTRQYLSVDLAKVLVQHARSNGIELTPDQWHHCVITAVEAGARADVKEYLKHRADAVKRLVTSSKRGESETDEGTEQGSGLGSEKASKSSSGKEVARQRKLAIGKQISEMIAAQAQAQVSGGAKGQTIDELLDTLEPYIYQPEPPATEANEDEDEDRYSDVMPTRHDSALIRYAWSTLLHLSSKDRRLTSDTLIEMAGALPGEAVVGHTLTPVMYGLVRRGEPLRAWEIWRSLIKRERLAPPILKGMFVDRVALAVATEACHGASNLEAAVTLVDTWAWKPSRSGPPLSGIPIFKAKNAVTSEVEDGHIRGTDKLAGTIPLDVWNLNVLLNMCKLEGKPSIAFRLWSAAIPRYGVHHDDVSLNLLLDIARYSDPDELEEQGVRADDADLFRRRLRAMAAEFRFGRRSSHDSEKEEDSAVPGYGVGRDGMTSQTWAEGPTTILLDPAVSRASRSSRAGTPELPWETARRIFRQVILGNWPHLEAVKSPLDVSHGALESIASFFGTGRGPSGGAKARYTDGSQRLTGQVSLGDSMPRVGCSLPSPQARYTHIIPTSSTFRSYIGLLGYFNLHAEIPLVLGWMRALGVRPSWSTMCLALLHVGENEGPRRWVKGFAEDGQGSALVRDEQVLRTWLEGWLDPAPSADVVVEGEGDGLGNGGASQANTNTDANGARRNVVPTEDDVARSRRWIAEHRRRVNA